MSNLLRVAAGVASVILFTSTFAAPAEPRVEPAPRVAHAVQAKILAAARAGERLVSVGDHGVVLLSDDSGTSWRQAKAVPVDVQLNAVSFADARRGWAVGHWGVVLNTEDGGETWAVPRKSPQEDRPLFGVHFFDAQQGIAVGLWSLVLVTADGGKTWNAPVLPVPAGAKKADLNLYGLFATPRGEVYATSERGTLVRSADRGQTWSYVVTGYKGSFWTGAGLADGSVLVAGLRGTVYRSPDGVTGWTRVDSGTSASIVGIGAGAQGAAVIAAAVDGSVLRSGDSGLTFKREPPKQGAESLTAIALAKGGRELLFSRQGPVR